MLKNRSENSITLYGVNPMEMESQSAGCPGCRRRRPKEPWGGRQGWSRNGSRGVPARPRGPWTGPRDRGCTRW